MRGCRMYRRLGRQKSKLYGNNTHSSEHMEWQRAATLARVVFTDYISLGSLNALGGFNS